MISCINLNRIEFVITDACSGRCKHCSNGERPNNGGVDMDAAVNAVKKLAGRYAVESVMTFGGEPLLFSETVCKIHSAARGCGIPVRQLITNGFFTKDERKIDTVAQALCVSGVNDLLLSIDVFHQEYIPLEPVMAFAEALLKYEIPSLRVQPAWVVNENAENSYNAETKRLLKLFTDKGIRINEGNNVFPSGNALKHLGEYFAPPGKIDLSLPCGAMPYTERLDKVGCFGINPNGDVNLCSVTIGNIYNADILEIVDLYDPYANPAWKAVLDGGVPELLRYAKLQGIDVDTSNCRSACGVCRKVMSAIFETGEERRARIYPVILNEYNPAWPEWFRDEKAYLEQLIGLDAIVSISHIGSTAVPGLIAKPTVDMLLEIKREADLEKLTAALPSPEYTCLSGAKLTVPTPPPHIMFLKGYLSNGFAEKVYHIHVCYPGDDDSRKRILFRDYLVVHPEAAAEYAALKRELLNDYEHDRDGYTEAKGAFIKKIMEVAL